MEMFGLLKCDSRLTRPVDNRTYLQSAAPSDVPKKHIANAYYNPTTHRLLEADFLKASVLSSHAFIQTQGNRPETGEQAQEQGLRVCKQGRQPPLVRLESIGERLSIVINSFAQNDHV